VWFRASSGDWIECPWRDRAVLKTPHAADIIGAARTKTQLEAQRAAHARESAALTGVPMPVGTVKAIEAAQSAENTLLAETLIELGEGDLFDIED